MATAVQDHTGADVGMGDILVASGVKKVYRTGELLTDVVRADVDDVVQTGEAEAIFFSKAERAPDSPPVELAGIEHKDRGGAPRRPLNR